MQKEGLDDNIEKKLEVKDLSKEIFQEWEQKKSLTRERLTEQERQELDITEEERLKKEIFFRQAKIEHQKTKESDKKELIKKDINQFLDIAEKKGVSLAIKAVQKTNDPFLIDVFHDLLAKEGFFKGFKK